MPDINELAAQMAQEARDANALAAGEAPNPSARLPGKLPPPPKLEHPIDTSKPVQTLPESGEVGGNNPHEIPFEYYDAELAKPDPKLDGTGDAGNPQEAQLPGAPAAAPAPPQDINSLAAGMKAEQDQVDQQQAQLLQWRMANETMDAGKRADVLRYAAASGRPPAFVEQNLDAVKKEVDANQVDWGEVAQRQPELVRLLVEKPELTPLVKDDAANLTGVSWLLHAPFHAFADALGEELLHGRQFVEAEGLGGPENQKRIRELEAKYANKDYGADGFFSRGVVGAVRSIPYMAGNLVATVLGGYLGAQLGAAFGAGAGGAATAPEAGAGAVPGAAAGGAGGGAMGAYLGSGVFNYYEALGPLYWQLSQLKDAGGQPIDPKVAMAFAQGGAVMSGALMGGLLTKVGGFIPGGKQLIAKFTGSVVEKALQATATKALTTAAKTYGQHLLTGAAMMAGQQAINAAAAEGAKSVSGVEAQWSNVGSAATQGFTAGLQDMWLLSAFAPGRELMKDLGQARASAESTARLEAMTNSARASKLLERFPEGFRQVVERMKAEDGAVQNVYVPVEQWVKYWQAEKIDPGEMAARVMGDEGKAFAEAASTKGDLAIPVEKYLEKLGKTDHAARLVEDAKLRPDELTPRQFKEEQKRSAERMKEAAKTRGDELEQGKKEVEDFIREQAVAAGFEKEVAKANAKLVADYAGTLALRTGMSVRDAAAAGSLGQLRILGPKGEAVAQAARERFSRFLNPSPEDTLNQRLASMSPEARVEERHIHGPTGLLNEETFNNAKVDGKPLVGRVSVEGIKYLNDKVSHDHADELYRVVAATLHEAAPDSNAAFIGGDFALRVKDQAELAAILAKVNERIPVKGFQITGAVGKDFEAAGAVAKADKGAAEAAGTRAKRGEKPLGFTGEPGDIKFPEGEHRRRARATVPEELAAETRGLTDKEYFSRTYRDATGAWTAKGWDNIPRKAHVIAFDLSGLGLANEVHGTKMGDEMIARMKRVAMQVGGAEMDFAHLHGDEYAAEHDNPAVAEAFVKRLKEGLAQHPVEYVERETGQVAYNHLHFWYGIGERSYENADRVLNERKRQAKASGEWVDPEAFPPPADARHPLEVRRGGRPGSEGPGRGEAGGDGAGPGADTQGLPGGRGEAGSGASGQEVGDPERLKKEALAAIVRMKPERQAQALAWFQYAEDIRPDRPVGVPDALVKQLAEYGVVDPQGYGFDEKGRSLERPVGGPKVKGQEPAELRRQRLERDAHIAGKPDTVKSEQPPMAYIEGQPVKYFQPAWHGSPHRFEQFSLQKIGSGEGAQVYGWGLYFAGEKQVAEHYRQALSGDIPSLDGKHLDEFTPTERAALHYVTGARANLGMGKLPWDKALPKAVETLSKEVQLRKEGYLGEPGSKMRKDATRVIAEKEAALAFLQTLTPDRLGEPGQLYKVDLPDHPELLDYDKPFAKQSPRVIAALRSAFREAFHGEEPEGIALGEDSRDGPSLAEGTGKDLYLQLASHLGSPQAASEALLRAGIPGLKYLDGDSRSKGRGSHNYVIWDDGRVKVTDTLYQPGDEGSNPRGSIQMQLDPNGKPRSFDITALGGDRSTLLHETAHFLSWSLHDVATGERATPELQKDYQELTKWAGYDSPEQRVAETQERADLARKTERTPAEDKRLKELSAKEERISHGWEQYLLEGKAPSEGLARVFSKFRDWLLTIYRGVEGLKAQYRAQYGQELGLSDEVRGIFDRLLARDEAVKQAQAATGAAPAGEPDVLKHMSPAEREAYRKALAGSRMAAEQDLARRAAELETKQLDEARQRFTQEVTAEVDSQPVYRAMRFLQTGELVDENGKRVENAPALLDAKGQPYKLNRKAFLEKYGPDVVRRMPPDLFARTKKGGVAVDELAPLLGYDDGDALVQAFGSAEPREQAIRRKVQGRIDDAYGPALQAIQDAAMSAVHNDASARATLLELRALAKEVDPATRARVRSIDLNTLKASATRLVGETPVGSLEPARFAKAERSTALKAAELWGAGKKAEALEQREARLFNQLLYRAAQDAQERLDKVHDKLEGTSDNLRADMGKADPAYRDVHDALLHAVGLSDNVPGGLSLDEMLKRADQDAQDVAFDVDAVRQLLQQPKEWEALTVDEARTVADAITNIRHIARGTLELQLAGKRQTKEAWFAELQKGLGGRDGLPPAPFDRVAEGWSDKAKHLGRGFDAILTDVPETYSHMLDVGERNGPAHRLLVDARLEARELSAKLSKEVLAKVMEKFENIPKDIRKLLDKRVDVGDLLPVPPGTEARFAPVYTRSTLWSLFLNWGNEDNRQRVRDGNGWTDDNVVKALGLLSKPELQFLQGVLDTINSLYPRIAEAHERRTGLRLGKVEATPFSINGEEYAGGYFPLKYRADASRAGELQEGDTVKSLFAPNYVRPTTPKGHTKERLAKVDAPVDLSWGVVPAHLSQVIHDISYGDWVRQTGSILLDKRFKDVAAQYLGTERSREFVPWLRDVANAKADSGSAAQSDFLQRIGGFARNRAAIAVMGLNLPAILPQVLDPWNALQEDVSPGHVASAYVKVNSMLAGLTQMPELQLSKEIAYRDSMMKENLRSKLGELGPTGKGFGKVASETMFALYELSDHYTSRVTWKAAFDHASSDGMSEAEAASRADDVVRRTYASHDIAEKPPIMRSKKGIAALVMFYSFANRLYNSMRRSVDTVGVTLGSEDASAGDKTRAVAQFAGKLMFMGLTGAAVAYIAGRGPQQEQGRDFDLKERAKWLAWRVALEPFNTVPFLGGIMESVVKGQQVSVRTAPELALVQDTLNRISKAIEKGEGEEKVWAAIDALVALAGGPAGQVQRTLGYARKLQKGETRPRGALDVAGGLFYGEKKTPTANPLTDAQKLLNR